MESNGSKKIVRPNWSTRNEGLKGWKDKNPTHPNQEELDEISPGADNDKNYDNYEIYNNQPGSCVDADMEGDMEVEIEVEMDAEVQISEKPCVENLGPLREHTYRII